MTELLSQITALLPVFLASPTVYAGILLIITSPNHPKSRALAAWIGSVLVIVVIGAVAVTASGAVSGPPRQPTTLSGIIDLLLGAFLLYAGIKRLIKKPDTESEKEKPKVDSTSTEPQLIKYAGIGILLTVTNPTSLASYLTAAKFTVDSGLSSLQQTTAMVVAGFYYSLPILWPLLLTVAAPASSEKILNAVNRAIKKYGRYIVAAIVILLGLYLALKGWDILT